MNRRSESRNGMIDLLFFMFNLLLILSYFLLRNSGFDSDCFCCMDFVFILGLIWAVIVISIL